MKQIDINLATNNVIEGKRILYDRTIVDVDYLRFMINKLVCDLDRAMKEIPNEAIPTQS